MASYDWNKNGKSDSFDRYMDYKASHLTSVDNNENDSYDEDYYDDDELLDFDEEKFEKIKQHLLKQEKTNLNKQPETRVEEKPPYLVITIISILVGVFSGIIAALVNK